LAAHQLQARPEGRQPGPAADRAHAECRDVDADVEIAVGQRLYGGDRSQSREVPEAG
jgi:hypothetical protein